MFRRAWREAVLQGDRFLALCPDEPPVPFGAIHGGPHLPRRTRDRPDTATSAHHAGVRQVRPVAPLVWIGTGFCEARAMTNRHQPTHNLRRTGQAGSVPAAKPEAIRRWHLESIIEGIADGVIVVDDDRLVRFHNRVAAEAYGIADHQVLPSAFQLPSADTGPNEVHLVGTYGKQLAVELRGTHSVEWLWLPAGLHSRRHRAQRDRAAPSPAPGATRPGG